MRVKVIAQAVVDFSLTLLIAEDDSLEVINEIFDEMPIHDLHYSSDYEEEAAIKILGVEKVSDEVFSDD